MNCRQASGLLSEYVDGRLSTGRSRRLEQHLADCPRCRQELAELRAMVARIAELPEEVPPASVRSTALALFRVERRRERSRRHRRYHRIMQNLVAPQGVGVMVALAAIVICFASYLEIYRTELAHQTPAEEAPVAAAPLRVQERIEMEEAPPGTVRVQRLQETKSSIPPPESLERRSDRSVFQTNALPEAEEPGGSRDLPADEWHRELGRSASLLSSGAVGPEADRSKGVTEPQAGRRETVIRERRRAVPPEIDGLGDRTTRIRDVEGEELAEPAAPDAAAEDRLLFREAAAGFERAPGGPASRGETGRSWGFPLPAHPGRSARVRLHLRLDQEGRVMAVETLSIDLPEWRKAVEAAVIQWAHPPIQADPDGLRIEILAADAGDVMFRLLDATPWPRSARPVGTR